MNVETDTSPPDPDTEDDGDHRSSRLTASFIRSDRVILDASVQLLGDQADDPARFADAVLAAALAMAQLAGPDYAWATMQRLAAYDGTVR